MKKLNYIITLAILLTGISVGACAISDTNTNIKLAAVTSAPPTQTEPQTKESGQNTNLSAKSQNIIPVSSVDPIAVIKRPSAYLNKKIQITARFNKFATLGLDYKPAMRSSETYISFLIYRPDTDKNIPLSEMKLFLTRKSAEKLIDLKEGDVVKFTGTVFSNALGDAWIDVDNLAKVNTTPKKSATTK